MTSRLHPLPPRSDFERAASGRSRLRRVLRVSATLALPLATLASLGAGCSDDPQEPAGTGGSQTSAGSGGSAGSSTGNAGSDSGAGGSDSGGSDSGGSGGSATAGSGGSDAAGSGGGDMGGERDPSMIIDDSMCSGISNGSACTLVGTCANRSCGLADLGSRNCVCGLDSIWDCESCGFPMDFDEYPVLAPPGVGDAGAIEACENSVADDVPCPARGDRCTIAGEICACWIEEPEDSGSYVWDCDGAPNFWPED